MFNDDLKEIPAEETNGVKEIDSKYNIDRSSREAFVRDVSNALIDYLDEDTLNFVKETSDILWLHFGLGLAVRNTFIYPHWDELKSFQTDADGLSEQIVNELKKRLNGK